jgi:DNA invertase Pin-like site-specific DNA recombinase
MISRAADRSRPPTTAKWAVYARSAAKDDVSTRRQIVACVFACGPASRITGAYVDDGWSGMDMARPGFRALMDDALHRSFDHLVVEDPERLSRSFVQALQIIQTLIDRGVATYCVEKGRLTPVSVQFPLRPPTPEIRWRRS